MGRARFAALLMILTIVMLPGCTGPDDNHAGDTPPGSSAITGFGSSLTTSPALRTSLATSTESASPEPLQISYPPETYTRQVYILCGQRFAASFASGMTMYVTQNASEANPDLSLLPTVLTDVDGFGVVFGTDCAHGGSVEVSPSSSAAARPLAASSTGTLVAAEITKEKGSETVVTIRPDDGSQPTVVTVHWQH